MPSVFKRIYTDAKGHKRRSAKWYGRVKDTNGRVNKVPLCRDKAAAEAMLREMTVKSDRAAAGIADPFEKHRKTPLAEHVLAYGRHLESKNDTAEHVAKVLSRIRAVFDGCQFRVLADLDADTVANWLKCART